MASNPAGQSCANCSFYIGNNCKAIVPSQAGSAPIWASPPPDDWCRFWNVWPQTGTHPSPGPPAPAIYWGQASPSGGNDGDFWVQYGIVPRQFSPPVYYSPLTIYQRQNGNWVTLVSNPTT